MDLSLIIICCDDPNILNAIDSVDVDIPVIVSIVPNEDLESQLQTRKVQIVHSIRGNCSISRNRGLAVIKTKRVFFMDSDCTLEPGCLKHINRMLDKSPVVRSYVNYEHSPHICFSNKIAQLRDIVNNHPPIPAYMPGVGIRTEIISALGGYFFDERLFWASDSELNKRILRADLNVVQVPEAVITHKPISLSHELRSGFKQGMGTHAQVKLGLRPPYESPTFLLKKTIGWLTGRLSKHGRNLPRDFVARLIYQGWVLAFYLGYYRVFFRRPEQIGTHC